MRVTLKTVNDEMAKRGYFARLVTASGYFYFERTRFTISVMMRLGSVELL
jgi:hypothetical protein